MSTQGDGIRDGAGGGRRSVDRVVVANWYVIIQLIHVEPVP